MKFAIAADQPCCQYIQGPDGVAVLCRCTLFNSRRRWVSRRLGFQHDREIPLNWEIVWVVTAGTSSSETETG